jgi:uncharacterized membrane protein
MKYRYLFIPLLLLLFFSQSTAHAQRTFYWSAYDVDIELRADGTLDITEHQTINFLGGDFTYGYATIPRNRLDNIDNISVREGDTVFTESSSESPFTFRTIDYGSEVEINWYFPPSQGKHTYTFSYTVSGAVRVEENGSQVFWMAIPSDVPGRIEQCTVTMRVPSGVTIGSALALVNGSEIAPNTYTISDDQRSAVFSYGNLGTGDTFETGIRFPTGQLDLTIPDWQRQEAINDTIGLTILVISILMLIGLPILVLAVWYSRGRDPDVGLVAEYLESPPSDLSPAIVGSLIDEKADMADIISTIVDLAKRGYLTIHEDKKDHEYRLTDKDWAAVQPFEKRLIRAIFGNKQTRKLSDLRYKFADKLPAIRQDLYAEMVQRGFFNRSPETVRNGYRAVGILAAVLGLVGFIVIGGMFDGIATAVCPGLALIPAAVLLIFTASHMPRKTEKGAEAAARWVAFKNYLRNIEKYTDLQAAGDIFEQFLPYAVAFGLERSWISKFKSIPTVRPPIWYDPFPHTGRYGRRGGSVIGFPSGGGAPASGGGLPSLEGMAEGMSGGLENMSQGLTRMLNSTSTVMQSVKSSNSGGGSMGGGGSFGGGFSGGSSGGGGRGFG